MLFPIRNDKFDSFWRTGNIKFKLYQGYINVKYPPHIWALKFYGKRFMEGRIANLPIIQMY